MWRFPADRGGVVSRKDRVPSLTALRAIYTRSAPQPNWGASYVYADVWWCGDYHCDCTQPQIEIIRPNRKAGRPWIEREVIWSGTFRSWSSDEHPGDADRELADALRALESAGLEILW